MLKIIDFVTVYNLCEELEVVVKVVKGLLAMMQFAIPILLIIMGTIDLGKAVISSDEKEMKGSVSRFFKRAMAAIAVYLLSSLVVLTMEMVSRESSGNKNTGDPRSFIDCWTGTHTITPNKGRNNDEDIPECSDDYEEGTECES